MPPAGEQAAEVSEILCFAVQAEGAQKGLLKGLKCNRAWMHRGLNVAPGLVWGAPPPPWTVEARMGS